MATDVMQNNEPSVTRLVSGIIDDTQNLLKQQADLLKADLRQEINDAKKVGLSMAVAGALLGTGGLLLSFMLVHLLSWAFPELPLWGGYAIVGGLFTAGGLAMFFAAREKLDKMPPPGEQTVEGLKENLQWKTNPN